MLEKGNLQRLDAIISPQALQIGFPECVKDLLSNDTVMQMGSYISHGKTTTLEHCCAVTYFSMKLCRILRVRIDETSMLRGAFLHDFYLYDWHVPESGRKLHGFSHPAAALQNARLHFPINRLEANVIETHMWPLTFRSAPKCREAVVVCLIDKYCSFLETMGYRYRSKFMRYIPAGLGEVNG